MNINVKQIQVSDEKRLHQLSYTGVTEQKLQILSSHFNLLLPHLDTIVDTLYDEINNNPTLREIIEHHSTLERLKKTQKQYLIEAFKGIIDDAYIQNRYKVGKVHSRVGLGLDWYIATYSKYIDIISTVLSKESPDQQAKVINAIQCIFNFDIQIVLESYSSIELDRAANPLKYELNKIARMIGVTTKDQKLLSEFSGYICFQIDPITNNFAQLFSDKIKNHPIILKENKFNELNFNKFIRNVLLQLFQDKIYLNSELYFRNIRDWCNIISDGIVHEKFFFIVGECLIEGVKETFLNSELKKIKNIMDYLTAFEKLVKFTNALVQEIIKPYLYLGDYSFPDTYSYEISANDFGRITWVSEQIMGLLKERKKIDYAKRPHGKRCYEVFWDRSFPCTKCPVIDQVDGQVSMSFQSNNKDHYYKIRRIKQNEIRGHSRELLLMQDSTEEGKVMFNTLERLLQLAEYRDDETGAHVFRIGILSERLARLAGCDESFVENIYTGAQFHDIGKVGIPDSILKKPGKLTDEERESIKTHSNIGYQILANLDLPVIQMAASIARTHHEWWDGTGYPEGLAGEQIPLEGRIVAIVDVFDALLSKRSYKEAFPESTVKNIMLEGRNQQFDPKLIDLFMDMWDEFCELRENFNMDHNS